MCLIHVALQTCTLATGELRVQCAEGWTSTRANLRGECIRAAMAPQPQILITLNS